MEYEVGKEFENVYAEIEELKRKVEFLMNPVEDKKEKKGTI